MTVQRVLLVDDSDIVRKAVCTLLASSPEILIIAEARDGMEAIERAEQDKPDIILLDISMPRLSGIEAARKLRAVAPNSKILFLSECDSWIGAREALSTGAAGYVTKSDAPQDLLIGIQAISQGKPFCSHTLAELDPDRRDTIQRKHPSEK